MKQTTHQQSVPDFFAFSRALIAELVQEGRYGTSQSYVKAVTSLRNFLQQERDPGTSESLPIESIDDVLVYRYNRYLARRGVIRNSVSFYNRVLRAIYNKAVRRFRIPDNHPFSDAYTGVDRTRNRAVSETTIAKLINLGLSNDKSLELTRDLFVFSYIMRGMPFVDMAYLKKGNIRGNYIVYVRKKTGTRMRVRIESQVMRIIDKYSRPDSEFLLPILQGTDGESPESRYRRYQTRLTVHNRKLKELSKRIKGDVSLSSYVARHSWATAARNIDISMSVISESLGHSSERMTRIYLGTFNERLIDNANRRLMGRIKKFVSFKETNTMQRYL